MQGNIIKNRLEELAPSQETIQEDYDNIELTESEIELALADARKKKFYKKKQQDWWNEINSKPTWFTPSADDFKRMLLKTKSKSGKDFQITDWNREVVDQLCLYFSNDHRFAKDLNKGILIMGKPGTGKTHLMNFFSKNPKASYSLPTCKTITELYSKNWTSNDMTAIEYYSVNKKCESSHAWDQTELGFCFGDLGAESSETKSYGNQRNVMEEIIFNRYEAGIQFHYTHFTTNLNGKEIESKYGERFRDRIKEMCNVFTLDGPSWRA